MARDHGFTGSKDKQIVHDHRGFQFYLNNLKSCSDKTGNHDDHEIHRKCMKIYRGSDKTRNRLFNLEIIAMEGILSWVQIKLDLKSREA